MHGSYPPTCALDREKLLKETTANATGSGRAPAKYSEVQRQTRNVPRAREPPVFCQPLKSPRRGAFLRLPLGLHSGNLPTDCLQATEKKKPHYQIDSGVSFTNLVPER